MAETSVTHAHDTHEHADDAHLWEGGKEPLKASYGKLMMWYFLVSDAFTFAGFLIAYGALRFSMPSWPEPDFVFASFPFVKAHWPLVFVTFMTFVLIFSSVTMVRAVQEGHRENQRGVVYWMFLTILGGATFLGCQAYEWTTLIAGENMTVKQNPFGRHIADGIYLNDDGTEAKKTDGSPDVFQKGDSYLLHMHPVRQADGTMKDEFIQRKIKYTTGPYAGQTGVQEMGPKAFGALFFFITGFHGFHVFSGVLFLAIIAINAAGGVYAARRNGYEMVEKIGLYWHFVDLVWVFVFLVFYLL
ncbi:MAG: cytochrome c oxidase subunit 3 [Saprospiraceae bacterium]|nr:cytochrome c oxidase subunit 3 [Saprospiraceae bacterium]MCW5923877.1 cytochrome c oxidase subunit 3 [Saprospiraceae bacterium]